MISGIILGAGSSSRMGRDDKLLLSINGMPIIEHVIRNALKSKLQELVLVYQNPEVKAIGEKYGVKTIYNDISNLGQSTSLIKGIENTSSTTNAYMFLLGDMIFINKDIINKLCNRFYAHSDKIIVPYYDGKRGNPVIIPSSFKNTLLDLQGDCGARNIIKSNEHHIEKLFLEDKHYNIDIDTRKDYEEIKLKF